MARKEQERQIGNGLPFPVGSRPVREGIFTLGQITTFLASIQRENGAINHHHPDIRNMLSHAKKKRLDVLLIPDGEGISARLGKLIADNNRFIKIGAGVTVTTVIAAGALGFVIRRHRRSTR